MSLKETTQRIWPSLRLPFRNAVIAAAAMVLVTLFLPNWYRSEAKILPTQGQEPGGVQALAAALGVGLSNIVQDPTINYEDILNSRWVGEQLLRQTYEFHEASWRYGKSQIKKETLQEYLKADDLDLGMKALQEIFSTRKDLKTGLITVSVETRSPELSQAIAQRSTALLDQFLAGKTQTSGEARAKYANERLAEARGEYDQAEAAFKSFLEANRNYDTSVDPAVRLKGARLEMELGLRKQLLTTLALSREQAMLDAKNNTPVLTIMDPGNLPQEKSRPARSLLVIAAFLLTGLATLIGLHWSWIKARIFPEEAG